MIRVLLAEDQGMMRGALALLLGLEPDIEVVAEVGTGDEVVPSGARDEAPTSRCSTSRCPAWTGWTRRRRCATRVPECRVLILTTFGRPGYLRRAMEAGARGFLVKDAPVEELAAAIRRVLAGETRHRPGARGGRASRRPEPAHRRERDVLAAAVDGSTIVDIASRLFLSESTVRNYLSARSARPVPATAWKPPDGTQHGWL